MIGHERFGSGQRGVIVMNDWLSDTSSWDGVRAYLDGESLTWAFADLRGYGRSISISGEYTVTEAAEDVLELADALDWRSFSVVGHSMSCLVALHLAQQRPERVTRAVVLTPPPPSGLGADDATLEALQAIGRGDDAYRLAALRAMWAGRLSDGWVQFKVARWGATADRRAAGAYPRLFARDGMPDPRSRIRVPVLAISGELDGPSMRGAAVSEALKPLCETLTVAPIADSGHYPMQETPPLLVSLVQRFLLQA